MLDAMEAYFPKTVSWTKPEGGMFIWVTLPEGLSALDVFQKAMEKKVAFVPGRSVLYPQAGRQYIPPELYECNTGRDPGRYQTAGQYFVKEVIEIKKRK